MKKICFLIIIVPLIFGCSKGAEEDFSFSNNAPAKYQPPANEAEQGRLKASEYEKILVNDPNNVRIRLSLAQTYYSINEFDKAINNLYKVLEVDKDNLSAIINLGNIFYDIKNNAKGIEYYKKALEIDPNNVDVRCDLGTLYKRMDMMDVAIATFRKCLEINPNHINARHNLAVVLHLSGKSEEANKEMRIYDSLITFGKR